MPVVSAMASQKVDQRYVHLEITCESGAHPGDLLVVFVQQQRTWWSLYLPTAVRPPHCEQRSSSRSWTPHFVQNICVLQKWTRKGNGKCSKRSPPPQTARQPEVERTVGQFRDAACLRLPAFCDKRWLKNL